MRKLVHRAPDKDVEVGVGQQKELVHEEAMQHLHTS